VQTRCTCKIGKRGHGTMPFSFLMRHSSRQAEESRERNELGGGEEETRRLRVRQFILTIYA
jgi:hypothetical protein